MVHLLRHDVVLDTLHFRQHPSLLLERPLNENVVLAKLLGEFEDDGALLFSSLLNEARKF